MEPIKRKKSPLEQAYQSVADGFSGKKEVRHSYYEPIFVLDEEWNTLKQQEQESSESPLSKEQISNQRAKRERVLARGFEASPYAKYKEHKEDRKVDLIKQAELTKQWEALEEQVRTNPRIGLSYTFQVAQQRLFVETRAYAPQTHPSVETFCPHTPPWRHSVPTPLSDRVV
jgi:hypothetical protein